MSNVPNKAPQVISAAGAVTPTDLNAINAAGALALTLAAPTVDGAMPTFWDETGHAHTITSTGNFNGGAKNALTFGGTVGNFVTLVARNGFWWVLGFAGVTES